MNKEDKDKADPQTAQPAVQNRADNQSATFTTPPPGKLSKVEPKGRTTNVSFQAAQFTGPIPPPSILQGYKDVDETFANRIVKMAEKQEDHRIEIENWAVKGGTTLAYVGAIFAFLISIFVVYLGYQAVMAGHEVSGTIFAGAGLVGVVSAFIYGTRSRRAERENKNRDNRQLVSKAKRRRR